MPEKMESAGRRVVLVYWKSKTTDAFEVFSNLKIFCEQYPVYSYNTLNNYLSKQKIAYENEQVHVERKKIKGSADHGLRILPVVRKGRLREMNEESEDVQYWLSRPASERIAAVTFLVSQSLAKGDRMDKTTIRKRKLKRA